MDMRVEVLLFGDTPTFIELTSVVRKKLGWDENGSWIYMEGWIDVG